MASAPGLTVHLTVTTNVTATTVRTLTEPIDRPRFERVMEIGNARAARIWNRYQMVGAR